LGNNSRNIRIQLKIPIRHEETTNTPEIYCSKEIFQIQVQDISAAPVRHRVCDYGPIPLETVRDTQPDGIPSLNLIHTIIENLRQVRLK
jgi:hypothetical protein